MLAARLEGHKLILPNGSFLIIGRDRRAFPMLRLVRAFVQQPGIILTRNHLMTLMWPGIVHDAKLEHSLDETVSRLNRMSRDVGMLSLITHAKGIGYAWSPTIAC